MDTAQLKAPSSDNRAHRALIRAGFTDPAIATAVLRQVQVLTMTATLARLDYRTAAAAQAAIASLIASPVTGQPIARETATGENPTLERAPATRSMTIQ